MPSSSAIRAGRAFVELFTDDKGLVRGLKAAQARLQAFGASVAKIGAGFVAIGASITAPIAAAATSFAKVGDVVDKTAQRTGLAAESLSQLAFVLSQSGSSLEDFERGFRNLQRNLGEAAAGSKTAQQAFEALGLDFQKLLTLSPEQQFLRVAEAISRVNNPALQAAAAMDIFGRSGTALLPTMQMGADGIEAMMKRADELGLTLSGPAAKSAAALNDALDGLQRVWQAIALTVGAAVAPAITQFATQFTAVAAQMRAWVADNQQLVTTVGALGVGLTAAGAALAGFGVSVSAMGTGLGVVVKAFTAFNGLVSGAVAIIGALASPVGLLVAGIAAIAAATVDWSAAWGKIQAIGATAMEALSGGFASLQSAAQPVFDAIGQAATGLVEKIKPIVDIVTGALASAWQTVAAAAGTVFDFIGQQIEANQATITEWGTLVVEVWRNAAEGVIALWGTITEAAGTAIDWINEQWHNLFGETFTQSLASAFNLVVTTIRNILDLLSLLTTNWELTWELAKNAAGTALFFVLDLVPRTAYAIIGIIKGAATAISELISAIATGDFDSIGTRMAHLFAEAFQEQMSQETPFTGILEDFRIERDQILAEMEAERNRLRSDRAAADANRPAATPAGTAAVLPNLPTAVAGAAGGQAMRLESPELEAAAVGLEKAAESISTAQDQVPEAMAVGSREAAERILQAVARSEDENLARQQIAESKKATAFLDNINKALRNAPLLAASTI